jgi:transketolase
MRSLPNMVVVAPCDAAEARAAMFALDAYDGPAYLRLTRDPMPVVTPVDQPFVLGRGCILREGTDIGLVSTGSQTLRVLDAADALARDGISAAVLHLPTIKPLDRDAIVDIARKTGAILTCEEHSTFGGLGGAVAEVLGEAYPTRVVRLGLRDVDGESGPNDALIEKYGLSAAHVVAAARAIVKPT